jgi:LuxR family quorum sensing-dependent transcriptional regulator
MDGPEHHWGIRALEFVDAIEASRNPSDVTRLFQEVISEYGFHAYVVGWLTVDGDRVKDHLFANGWPAEWAEIYLRDRLVEHDPIPRHGLRSVDPFEWSEAPLDPEREPLSLSVMERARDFKMDQGFFVPIHLADGASGGVSLAGERPDFGAGVKPALHLMALYAHSRIRSLIEPGEQISQILTPREREVLQWTAAGKSSWEIGLILSISERTVNAHIQAAMRKLDSVNRIAAVVTALRRREIQL